MAYAFIVEQKQLLSLLSSIQPICAKRTTLEITSYILFNIGHKELILKSTDLEISLQASCSLLKSDIDEPISFLVQGRRIFDIVKELDGDIACVLNNNQLTLEANTVNLALNIKNAEEFPPFPERIENLMQLDASLLLNMFERVAFLIPQNNANHALNGLFLEIGPNELKMTSTDGHCLAQVRTGTYTLKEEHTWLLPRRAIFEIKKIVENTDCQTIFFGICGNQVVFSGESFNFFSKLLADKFPQYDTILQRDGFVPAKIIRSNFVKTLRRSACLLSGQFLATQFGFEPHKLNVSIQNKEVGNLEENLELQEFEGEKLDIRFYAPYLLNGLQTFSDDQVTFYLKNAAKPIIFEAQKELYQVTYLVMHVSPTAKS